jgi:hypothetical protein
MFTAVRSIPTPRRRAASLRRCLLAACAAGLLVGAAAPAAQATNHDYCNWDSTYAAPGAYVLCAEPSAHFIYQNYAYLPFGETDSAIYCGASLSGVQYGSNTVGTTSCVHAYAGTNNLTAYTYIGPVSHYIHGIISY